MQSANVCNSAALRPRGLQLSYFFLRQTLQLHRHLFIITNCGKVEHILWLPPAAAVGGVVVVGAEEKRKH